MRRRVLWTAWVIQVVCLSGAASPSSPPFPSNAPPAHLLQPRQLVRYKEGGAAALRRLCSVQPQFACDWSAELHRTVIFTSAEPIQPLLLSAGAHDWVEYVEEVALLSVPVSGSPEHAEPLRAEILELDSASTEMPSQPAAAPWHLDRLDQESLPLDGSFTAPGGACGAGAHIFVLDTGLMVEHVEFGSAPIGAGFNSADNGEDTGNWADCHGHGSHVSAIAAGAHYGVAPCATIHPVRVFGCGGFGSTAAVLSGLAFVAQQVQSGQVPAVASLSVGGAVSRAVNDAVDALSAMGVLVVTSAGNDGGDACLQSPASARTSFAVGAATERDSRASFSNAGPCVSLYAPGVTIRSAWYAPTSAEPTQATKVLSGTSQACPAATGAAALFRARFPNASVATTKRALAQAALSGAVADAGLGSRNALLNIRALCEGNWTEATTGCVAPRGGACLAPPMVPMTPMTPMVPPPDSPSASTGPDAPSALVFNPPPPPRRAQWWRVRREAQQRSPPPPPSPPSPPMPPRAPRMVALWRDRADLGRRTPALAPVPAPAPAPGRRVGRTAAVASGTPLLAWVTL